MDSNVFKSLFLITALIHAISPDSVSGVAGTSLDLPTPDGEPAVRLLLTVKHGVPKSITIQLTQPGKDTVRRAFGGEEVLEAARELAEIMTVYPRLLDFLPDTHPLPAMRVYRRISALHEPLSRLAAALDSQDYLPAHDFEIRGSALVIRPARAALVEDPARLVRLSQLYRALPQITLALLRLLLEQEQEHQAHLLRTFARDLERLSAQTGNQAQV